MGRGAWIRPSETISDHAAVCYERPVIQEQVTVNGRPVLPRMKEWSAWHHKKFEGLAEDVAQRAADKCGNDTPRTIWNSSTVRELLDAAEAVEQQRLSRGRLRITTQAGKLCHQHPGIVPLFVPQRDVA